jgi:ubiquinone/menaquinone biosynthesis C-methylase UbiE
MSNYTENTTCPLCGEEENLPYAYEEVTLKGINNKLGINKCIKCSLVYTSPRLNSDGLKILYDELYATHTVSGTYNVSFDSAEKEYFSFKDYVHQYLPNGGRILDIGCGTGNFLSQFKNDKRYDIEGVEFSSFAAKEAREKGVKVHLGDILALNITSQSYDCVSLIYVLEHFPRPLDLLIEIHRLLKTGGYCFIAVPNFNYLRLVYTGLVSYVFFRKKTHLFAEEHLQNFTPKTLSVMIKKAGYSIVKWEVAKPLNVGNLVTRLVKQFLYRGFHWLSYFGINLGGIHLIVRKTE